MTNVYLVRPSEVLTWAFDWATNWLPSGDSISTYAWTIYDGPSQASGVTLSGASSATVTVPASLTSGKVYHLKTIITTADGLTGERDIVMRCA